MTTAERCSRRETPNLRVAGASYNGVTGRQPPTGSRRMPKGRRNCGAARTLRIALTAFFVYHTPLGYMSSEKLKRERIPKER